MTADRFREVALSFAETTEAGHLGHPDFRRNGKIFATLGYPDIGFGMLKLSPEEQAVLIAARPAMFAPANGAWGRGGSTLVDLHAAREDVVRQAMALAWEGVSIRAVRPGRRAKK